MIYSWPPTPSGMRARLRIETLARPPPCRGSQPSVLSSLVITCARTFTNESLWVKLKEIIRIIIMIIRSLSQENILNKLTLHIARSWFCKKILSLIFISTDDDGTQFTIFITKRHPDLLMIRRHWSCVCFTHVLASLLL